MSWAETRLGDVITLKRGHDLPDRERKEGSIPVVSSAGITGYHDEAKALGPGVVTGRYGTLGEVYFIKDDYWPLNTALYVSDFKGNSPRFVAYFLKNALRNYQSDKAAVPGVDRNVLHELNVRVPTLKIQDRIADVLAAYDDFIENNRRRMALLEESARLLYKEWFVRLRFPGHEKTRITKGIPGGWKRQCLGEICADVKETVRPEDLEPETPYIGLEHMPRRSISLDEWGCVEMVSSTKHQYLAGDIIFGKIRPYFHKVGIAFVDGVTSSDAIVIRANPINLQFLLLMIVSSDEFISDVSTTMREGSKMPRADWKLMKKFPILLPPEKLLMDFSMNIACITSQLKTLCFQNKKLRAARDLLLPRLMSGEIAV